MGEDMLCWVWFERLRCFEMVLVAFGPRGCEWDDGRVWTWIAAGMCPVMLQFAAYLPMQGMPRRALMAGTKRKTTVDYHGETKLKHQSEQTGQPASEEPNHHHHQRPQTLKEQKPQTRNRRINTSDLHQIRLSNMA